MNKLHKALAAIRSRQATGSKVDAAPNVGAKEDEPLPSSEATPSQAGRSPVALTDGSDSLTPATPPDDGIPSSERPTVKTTILARTHTEDFSEAIVAAQAVVEFHEFSSSNIKSATFDGGKNVLLVQFSNGKAFCYENVTAEQWKTWKEAKSAGQWFHTQIRQRPKVHPFKEVKSG